MPIRSASENLAQGIAQAHQWSLSNNMFLNDSKTVILNVAFSERLSINDPADSATFLGLTTDKTLTFSEHTTTGASKRNSWLHLMRQLRQMGMNSESLLTFYKTNAKAVTSYAAPAWFWFTIVNNKRKLESIQRTPTRIILPETDSYTTRLNKLSLPTVSGFLFDVFASHLSKIAEDPSHPLFNRVTFNTFRTSSRRAAKFYPGKCGMETYSKTFFRFYESF